LKLLASGLSKSCPKADQGAYAFTGLRALNDRVDLTFGARWNAIKGNIEFKGPLAATVGETKQWVDPIVGLKIHQRLGGRWHLGLVADIGGFGAASKFAWQVFPTLAVDVGKRARLGFGCRALGMDYKTGSDSTLFRYDVIANGPVLGMSFNF